MALTIDDLLNSLQNPNKPDKPTLENNRETWSRIGRGDPFSELGIQGSDLEEFLKDFISNNPYNNL